MSLVRVFTLWCDADGCGEERPLEHDEATLRRWARAAGWVHVDGKDYCHMHAPASPTPKVIRVR